VDRPRQGVTLGAALTRSALPRHGR
jgi:hypothetical protein